MLQTLPHVLRSFAIALPAILIAGAAAAGPINGTIGLQTVTFPSIPNELDLVNDTVSASATVTSASGDLSVLLGDTIVLDFDYGNLPDTLWSAGGFTFTALSADVTEFVNPVTGSEELTLTNGVGSVSGAGYDTTAAVWEFGATESGDLFFTLEFSAETDGGGGTGVGGSPVPEPSAPLLFAIGMLLAGWSIRSPS